MRQTRSPIATGVGLALLAALSFGATTPMVARAGRGLGPLSTAALLYAGACLSSFVFRKIARAGAPLGRAQLPRLLTIAFFGAGVAPTLFAWGLQRSGAMATSLLLNLEAGFTVLLAWLAYREHISLRVAVALVLMTLGGGALAFSAEQVAHWNLLGVLAVAAATAAWALDNTLTRALASHDPAAVVAGKGLLGATLTGLAALVLREPAPGAAATVVLVVAGATGYGLSLRLYILAQRHCGAARTGSIFAFAPFVGTALAWGMGERMNGAPTLVAGGLLGLGVLLHATERHRHKHVHLATTHDHVHRHDDGHHDHLHDPPFQGEHAHAHEHAQLEHAHEHAPDLHHDHNHD